MLHVAGRPQSDAAVRSAAAGPGREGAMTTKEQ
jgi:hypothetical protein